MRGFVHIEAHYRAALARLGLTCADDFLRLQGTILGGHPDRHVMQVTLGESEVRSRRSQVSEPVIRAFLKKEHRVPWKQRLENWWHGFGWISKSVREGRMLQNVAQMRVGCAEVIAFGESRGRAFLLVREADGFAELRETLGRACPLSSATREPRRELARALGRELARLHALGIVHGDLFAKHVLTRRAAERWQFCLLDWQRAQRRRTVSWKARCRDLAALDATLADELAAPGERMACLVEYLRTAGFPISQVTSSTLDKSRLPSLVNDVRAVSARLQKCRRVRELRCLPAGPRRQNLIWLDGERLCVTRQFLQELGGVLPDWLLELARPTSAAGVCVSQIPFNYRLTTCVRRRRSGWDAWLRSIFGRRRFPAPEFQQAALLFRLERQGQSAPRVLAVGHQSLGLGRKYSFLLTEEPAAEPHEVAA